MIVCTIETRHGARYEIRQVSTSPLRYVACCAGPVEYGAFHRDHLTYQEAHARVGLMVANTEMAVAAAMELMGR